MRGSFIAIAAAAAMAACGGDGPDQELRPQQLVIIAGDKQVAAVAEPAAGGSYSPLADVEGVLPDTLVTEIQGDTVTVSSYRGTLTEPVFSTSAALPPPAGTVVEYAVLGAGCGGAFISSSPPDSLNQTKTLWKVPGSATNLTGALSNEPGVMEWWPQAGGDSIWSARCEMEARAKVGDTFGVDTTFVAYFEPGPVDPDYDCNVDRCGLALARSAQPRIIPSRLHLAADQYGNPVPSCPVFEPTDSMARNEGATWPECRTVFWEYPPEGTTAGGPVAVYDVNGVQVGHGYYEIRTGIHAGGIYFTVAGMNRPCAHDGYCPGGS